MCQVSEVAVQLPLLIDTPYRNVAVRVVPCRGAIATRSLCAQLLQPWVNSVTHSCSAKQATEGVWLSMSCPADISLSSIADLSLSAKRYLRPFEVRQRAL